jgi:hypothetical protein
MTTDEQKKRPRRRVFKTQDLSPKEAEEFFSGRMDPRYDHLNEELESHDRR